MSDSYFDMAEEKIEKLIRAAGSELISRAGELAKGVERVRDVDIWIRFNEDEMPSIEVTKRYYSKEMVKVLANIDS